MTPVGWMVGASVGSWLGATAMCGGRTGVSLFLGMLAPLAATVGTWLAVESALRRNPAGVTRVMMMGFAVKMVFFGAYVGAVLQLGTRAVRPRPFVASFTVYFIALYLAEALLLRRKFAGRA